MRRDGWRIVTFGDVAKQLKEDADPESGEVERYVAGEHMITDDLRIRSWGTIGDGYLGPAFHRRFRPGQILYGSRRTYLRKVAVADFDGICANTTFVIEPKTDVIEPDLLPFIMQSEGFSEHSVRNSKGSVNPYVNWKDIASYEFPLPPLDEQRRIAEILWAVEEAINYFEECRQLASTAKNRLFNKLLIETVSDNQVQLADVCIIQNGQVDPTQEPYRSMIHIAPDDIESDTGRILEQNTAAEDGVASGNYYFSQDAILYSKIRPNLRKVAPVDFEGVCSADVYPIYAKPNIQRDFLYLLLLSPKFTSYATVRSIRSAIPKINREDLLKYSFDLPSITNQEKIVDSISVFENNIRTIVHHIQRLKELKQKCLGELLRGRDLQHV